MSSAAALWWLLRPRLLPFLLLLPFFGWAWAHWDRALPLQGGPEFLAVLGAWVLLHCGTMWLNAALDRDEGEVLMGRAVTPPPGIVPAGYAALAACVPLAAMGGSTAGICALLCALLAVGYSHPQLAWKGHAWFGPATNVLGYGVLSPLAGWSVVGVPTNTRTLVCAGLFAVGILAPYLAAQAFQRAEDAARGYRTFVVVYGPAATLMGARLAMAAVLLGGVVLAAIGWLPRACLIALPLWFWVDRHLVAWSRQPDGGDGSWATTFAMRALGATVILVVVSFGEYARASFAHEPVAGLGTAAGHPTDRPVLAPYELRRWEARHGIIATGGRGGRAD